MSVSFRLLGPVEVLADGVRVELPTKPLALLALLLLRKEHVVSTDALAEELWNGSPPLRAQKTLQVYVSQLRKAIGTDRIETRRGGYVLHAAVDEVDATRFEQLVQEGDADAALALWRGEPLGGFEHDEWAREPRARLESLWRSARERRAAQLLDAGAPDDALVELEDLVARDPYAERLRALQMLALYRSGRQADALDVYRRARATLVDELGIEPGAELRELQARILRQDPELRATPVAAAPESVESTTPRRRRLLVAAAALAVAAIAAVTAALVLRAADRTTPTAAPDGGDVRTYVLKVENFLAQSHAAHAQIAAAVGNAATCAVAPARAAVEITRVELSRQSLLDQLAALSVPARSDVSESFDLLQRAAQASIAADWGFRDWLRSRRACVRGARPPRSLLELDGRATRLKRAFVAAFDPLAHEMGAATWSGRDL